MCMNQSPLVILGAARSGTSFLRDVLSEAPGLGAVPYDVNYIWRYGHSASSSDEFAIEALTLQKIRYIQTHLSQLAHVGKEGRLLEKTVSNTLRVEYVAEALPDAKFIYIERNGREAATSAMRQWQSKPNWAQWRRKLRTLPFGSLPYVVWAAKNLGLGKRNGRIWGPRYSGIEADLKTLAQAEICAKQWRICCERARFDLEKLDQERVFRISYEDLIASSDPLKTLLKWAQLEACEPVLQAYSDRVRQPTKHFDRLPTHERAAIDQQLSPFLFDHGYI